MPMTRELKKRFMEVEDRISKLEKRGKTQVQKTNGEDLDTGSPSDLESRLETIEMVLQIPGPTDGETEVLSAWRQIIENKLDNIETVLVMPGEDGFLSGFANKVDKVVTSLKERVLKLEQIPDPSATVLEFDDRLAKLEKRVKTFPHTVHGKPLISWVTSVEERVLELEVKPVAGTLSNIMQGVNQDIEGTNREVKELRSRLRWTTWLSLCLFALIILTIITLL